MSDYDLDELLRIIGESPPEKEALPVEKEEEGSGLSDFLKRLNITKGVDRIPNYVIYYTYSIIYGGEKPSVDFFRCFNKEGFERVRTGKQRGYRLNKQSFDLSDKGLSDAKVFAESQKRKNNDKKEKKRRKVSKPRS